MVNNIIRGGKPLIYITISTDCDHNLRSCPELHYIKYPEMKMIVYRILLIGMYPVMLTSGACRPSVKLTSSWIDSKYPPVGFNHFLVLALGNDPDKRSMAETAIAGELKKAGYPNTSTSIDTLGPAFALIRDADRMTRTMLQYGFDALITIHVKGRSPGVLVRR